MNLDKIRIFLDENIYVLEKHLINQGIDVKKIPVDARGLSDEQAFAYAQQEKGFFLTINGKDFVILVSPKGDIKDHNGIAWIKFNITRNSAQDVAEFLVEFLSNEEEIQNSIFKFYKVDLSNGKKLIMTKEYYNGKKVNTVSYDKEIISLWYI